MYVSRRIYSLSLSIALSLSLTSSMVGLLRLYILLSNPPLSYVDATAGVVFASSTLGPASFLVGSVDLEFSLF